MKSLNQALNLRTNKWLQVSMLVGLSFLALTGCGARNTATGSDAGSTTLGSTSSTGTKPLAFCNRASSGALDMELTTYKDQLGNRNNSLVRLKFLNLPAELIINDLDINIRKFQVSPTGTVSPASNETQSYPDVMLQHYSSGVYTSVGKIYNSPTHDLIFWNQLQFDIFGNQNATNFTSAVAFFNEYHLLIDLNDSAGVYKYLQVDVVDHATGSVHATAKILIPTFEANPFDYQADHPLALTQLHPFYNVILQGQTDWSSDKYQSDSNAFCF